jgi:AP-1-like factor
LETKVDDLEKASESANHENSILRAQIEKMSTELREYRKRLSLNGNTARSTSLNNNLPAYMTGKGYGVNNPNDVNFQFEFPRFGRLPGPSPTTVSPTTILNGTRQSASPTTQQLPSPSERNDISPLNQTLQQYPVTNGSVASLNPNQAEGGDLSSLSGLFSPSILDSVSKSSPYEFFANNGSNGSRSSTDSNGQMSTGHNTSYSSPSASSNSNAGPSSSCGTSPEPSMQSPVYGKAPDPTLTTIGEEHSTDVSGQGELTFCDKLNMACGNPNNPVPRIMSKSGVNSGNNDLASFDVNGIDWFAQQNGNQFDPQLFGDYREPQDNILSGEGFSDSFFTDAFALPDFNSPFNVAPSPAPPKKDLVAQIDERQNEDEEVVPGEDPAAMLNCNTIWYVLHPTTQLQRFHGSTLTRKLRDRLQACPKVKEGEFDLDLLCKDLQKKAKCSETGAVVNESDFNKIMKSYVDGKGNTVNKV